MLGFTRLKAYFLQLVTMMASIKVTNSINAVWAQAAEGKESGSEPQGVAELWRTGHNMPLLQSQLYLAWAECCLEGNLSQCLDHSNISRGNRDLKFKNRDL